MGLSASACSGQRDSGEEWSAGPCNCQSIGIELEDKGRHRINKKWATDALYHKAAELVRGLCEWYGIPKKYIGGSKRRRPGRSRSRPSKGILGHVDVYNRTSGKDDPKKFDWVKFINLVDPSAPKPEPDDKDGGS